MRKYGRLPSATTEETMQVLVEHTNHEKDRNWSTQRILKSIFHAIEAKPNQTKEHKEQLSIITDVILSQSDDQKQI